MDTSKKLLLLGGSFQQLVAIRTAKRMGIYTILCDYLPDNPGQFEVDKYYNTSTTDVESVYNIAIENNVDGILAYASDPAALPAAIVAERMGIPTNPSKSVAILGVKHKFREFLKEHGFACPQYFIFNPTISLNDLKEGIKNFRFPIIIKPTDSSGSKGVTKLEKGDDLLKAIAFADKFSRNKTLIAEEFINRGFPDVIGGDIFVWNGKIELYGEMSCLRGESGSGLIPIGERFPSGLNEYQQQKVHLELQKIIDALDYKFGELNIEILLDENDNVHLLELGPRAGGNMIPIQLSDAFGIDLVKANIDVALGTSPNLTFNKKDGCYMHYVLHSYRSGTFKSVEISNEIEKFIYRKVLYKKEGDKIEYFDGAGKAIGIIFLKFDNKEQMLDFCANNEDLVKIKLK